MRVACIAATEHPDVVCGLAARVCSNPDKMVDLVFAGEGWGEDDQKKFQKTLRYCLKHGHESVFEHASFTFLIEGVSRACTHQLVRHRIASYSQASMRKPQKSVDILFPKSFQENEKANEVVREAYDKAVDAYCELIMQGIPAEDARFVLPEGTLSTIVVTMNCRELRHFIQMRDCKEAQWEIRKVAKEMKDIAEKQFPILFEDMTDAESSD